MKRFFFALAVMGLTATSVAQRASAQLLTVDTPTAWLRTTPSTAIVGPGLPFTVGDLALHLPAGDVAEVTYTFIGADARRTDGFYRAGGVFAYDNRTFAGAFVRDEVSASGLLDFAFRVGPHGRFVRNGDNDFGAEPFYGVHLDPGGLSGLLLFEDRARRRGRDVDDMLVRFDVGIRPVPEPASIVLMGLGVCAVGFARWRRSRADARRLFA